MPEDSAAAASNGAGSGRDGAAMHSHRFMITLLIALLALRPSTGGAHDSWLDGLREGWNSAGMAVPAAPASVAAEGPHCQDLERPVETAEDAAVVAQGWRLISAYEHGWGITLIGGFRDFDAMCRPVPYQQFVFVDGVFAGTLAPEPMVPRTDGALVDAGIDTDDRLYAHYVRYAPSDPLCCPSETTAATFSVKRTSGGPVVILDSERLPASPVATASADSPAQGETGAACVGSGAGRDALFLVAWTAEEIASHEARTAPADGQATTGSNQRKGIAG
ncbi:MAG: LppP/LprE family lipoprotein [Chloroflexota bacterium]|nr:LppP/LprE family lipoprotein [Chloroflexota bacterium]